MRRTAVSVGGAEACPPSPRVLSFSVSTPFSPTPITAAPSLHERQWRVDPRTALVNDEPRHDPAFLHDPRDLDGGGSERLLIAAERQIHVARGSEARGQQILDSLEHHDDRTLVVERAAPVNAAIGDRAGERRVSPRIELVDRTTS